MDQTKQGCRIQNKACSCGFGCISEYRYDTMAECQSALREQTFATRIHVYTVVLAYRYRNVQNTNVDVKELDILVFDVTEINGQWSYSLQDCMGEFRNEFPHVVIVHKQLQQCADHAVKLFREIGSVKRKEGGGRPKKRTKEEKTSK
ncbi:sushi, nidogen and EGF-like domain-containing protein 1, partial [Asbolus verrucosus]